MSRVGLPIHPCSVGQVFANLAEVALYMGRKRERWGGEDKSDVGSG